MTEQLTLSTYMGVCVYVNVCMHLMYLVKLNLSFLKEDAKSKGQCSCNSLNKCIKNRYTLSISRQEMQKRNKKKPNLQFSKEKKKNSVTVCLKSIQML